MFGLVRLALCRIAGSRSPRERAGALPRRPYINRSEPPRLSPVAGMISGAHRFVFLHVPKTGGNSIQSLLEPYSDDGRVVGGARDGHDRFEIAGPVTPFKHATLADYAQRVDPSGYRIAMGCREPFARAVSACLSPIHWVGATPRWSTDDFLAYLPTLRSTSDFIRPRSRPDYLLRFEALASDFAACVQALGLPAMNLPHRNRTTATSDVLAAAMADRRAKLCVQERFAEDYVRFGYTPD